MNPKPRSSAESFRSRERGGHRDEPLFLIHVMRTAGTSLRRMLEQAFGAASVYPTAEIIERHGRYPNLAEVIDDRDRVLTARFVVGHYPFVLRSLWPRPPFTSTLLRDPVERTISVLKFARLRRKHLGPSTSLAEVFEDEELNAAMIRNYQTKVFSIRRLDDTKGVNLPIPDSMLSLELAKQRLEECDFVGLTERFDDSIEAFRMKTAISLPDVVHTNRSQTDDSVDEPLRTRIMEATALDAELVDHAAGILDRQLEIASTGRRP